MVTYKWSFLPQPGSARIDNGNSLMTVDWVLTGTLDGTSASVSGSNEVTYDPITFSSPDNLTIEMVTNTVENGIGLQVVEGLKQEIHNTLTA